jgi:signal transduction histidine kinase
LKTAGLSTDILENDVLITEGKDRVMTMLKELADGNSQARFFDILFCEGCINGPKMLNELSVFARKEILANFVNDQSRYISQKEFMESLAEFEDLDLSRSFTPQTLTLLQPTEEEIIRTLQMMRKFTSEDQLNCGACGYPTCREKAIAICQGLAELDMCLPYLVEELEMTCDQLQQSHQELSSAQQRLMQSEKLASMGQISAGVAHEINNPLGTILLYSHMMLKEIKENDPRHEDFHMIANEATRCKNIVRGLLDFARQSRVSKIPTNLAALIEEVLAITAPKAKEVGVEVTYEPQDEFPLMMIDGDQIKQMLVNLVNNGIDAITGTGAVSISARLNSRKDTVKLEVQDNGSGIPGENLSKLFTPFFTTKEMGKGTGLGLAIAYGVVKMHSGDICVESEEGQGTTFFISFPVESV